MLIYTPFRCFSVAAAHSFSHGVIPLPSIVQTRMTPDQLLYLYSISSFVSAGRNNAEYIPPVMIKQVRMNKNSRFMKYPLSQYMVVFRVIVGGEILYMHGEKINSIFLKKSSKKGLTNDDTFDIITPVAERERTKHSSEAVET